MDDPAKSESDKIQDISQDKSDRQKALTEIVNAHENKEDLDELASKLSALWAKPASDSEKPDLSFSKFKEKIKKSKR